jgi:hypothetical protein
MTGLSRYTWRSALPLERLKDFVALEGLTAQVPLIEVTRKGEIKIWTAYDITRTHGTFTQVLSNGMVKTVTVAPSGRRREMINREASR